MTGKPSSSPTEGFRIAGYLRVSTDTQANEGYSLADQRAMIERHCAAEGWEIVDFYEDAGVSGAKAERDERERMFNDLEAGRVNAVLCINLKRFERGESFEQHLAFKRISDARAWFLTIEDRLNVGPDADPGELFVRSILGAVAAFDRAEIRAKTHRGVLSAARAGGWVGGKAPFGFVATRPGGRGPVKLEIDEKDAKTIRLIADLVVNQGKRFTEVTWHLNAARTETPSQSAQRKVPGYRDAVTDEWGSTLRTWVGRQVKLWGGTAVIRPKDTEPIEINVPAILDPETTQRLTAAVEEQRRDYTTRRSYLLSGRIITPCGSTMAPSSSPSGRMLWVCPPKLVRRTASGKSKWSKAHGCKSIPLEEFEAEVWAKVASELQHPERLIEMIQLWDSAADESESAGRSSKEDLEAIDRKIARTKKAIRSLVKKSALDDELDGEEFTEVLEELRSDVARLERHRETLVSWQRQSEAAAAKKGRLWDFARRVSEMLDDPDPDTAQRVVRELDLRVEVTGWHHCETCLGKRVISKKRVQETGLEDVAQLRGNGRGYLCPTCHQVGHIPAVRLTFAVAEVQPQSSTGRVELRPVSRPA